MDRTTRGSGSTARGAALYPRLLAAPVRQADPNSALGRALKSRHPGSSPTSNLTAHFGQLRSWALPIFGNHEVAPAASIDRILPGETSLVSKYVLFIN